MNESAPLLQTETTMLGNDHQFENQRIAPARHAQLRAVDAAGSGIGPSRPQQHDQRQRHRPDGGRPYVNGNREQANNFLLDGLDNNQVSDNLVGYTPERRRDRRNST